MNKSRSVFRKLAWMTAAIELFVLIGAGALVIHYARVQEEAERAAREEAAENAMEQIENQLQAGFDVIEQLSGDTRLSRVAYHMYPNEYERSQLILSIVESLTTSAALNPSIGDLGILFPSEEISLSSSGGYDNRVRYERIPPGHIDTLVLDDGELQLRIPHPLISDVLGEIPDYECRLEFSESNFTSALTVLGDNREQGALLIYTGENGPSAYAPKMPEGTEFCSEILERFTDGGPEAHGERAYISGHRYDLDVIRSQRYPFALVIWSSSDTFSSNMIFTLSSLLVLILVTSCLLIFLLYQTNRLVARPIRLLMNAFEQVGKGGLDTRIHHDQNDEFHLIYDSFNTMTERTGQLIENIKEQHNLLQNAELMQLQAQIDPHFLYNSFNIIKYMADGEEYEQITEFVSALAQYYRFINKETRQAIPLSAEVKHMETFLYIQQMRFEERIRVEMKGLPEDADSILVPKLILQPLVENCYNHGLKNKLENGVIAVEFLRSGSELFISVEDNGDEMDPNKLEELKKQVKRSDDQSVSHALSNIRRRLELAYGEPDMLNLSIGKLGGLRVTLHFDLNKKSDYLT